MLQVRVHGPGDVRVDEVATPDPGSRDAVVRVAACGICGSDLSYIKRGGVFGPGRDPMCLGHEMAGVVDWVGADVATVGVGDRVVVHPGNDELGRIGSGGVEGGLTPLLLVREAARGGRLFPVPHDLPLEVAALAEPLAVGMHAVDQAQVEPGESVAVFGCGPIGLAAIATLVDRGHENVVAVDMSRTRLELARGLGAHAFHATEDDVWSELARAHGTKPSLLGPTPATNVFIEASGAPAVIKDVLDRGPVGGRMVVVALHYGAVPISFIMLLMKEFTIRGAMEYPSRFENAIELLARQDLSRVITHRFPLDQFDTALAVLDDSKDCGKVLVTIDG